MALKVLIRENSAQIRRKREEESSYTFLPGHVLPTPCQLNSTPTNCRNIATSKSCE